MAPIWSGKRHKEVGVRKAMGAKPFPGYPDLVGKKVNDITQRHIKHDAVATYPIGIRHDKKKDFIFTLSDGTKQGFNQEGL